MKVNGRNIIIYGLLIVMIIVTSSLLANPGGPDEIIADREQLIGEAREYVDAGFEQIPGDCLNRIFLEFNSRATNEGISFSLSMRDFATILVNYPADTPLAISSLLNAARFFNLGRSVAAQSGEVSVSGYIQQLTISTNPYDRGAEIVLGMTDSGFYRDDDISVLTQDLQMVELIQNKLIPMSSSRSEEAWAENYGFDERTMRIRVTGRTSQMDATEIQSWEEVRRNR